MNKMFIPQEIKERLDRISVYDVAAKLNIEIKGNIAQCFMHDDQHPSLRFKKSNNSWKCYVCDKGGHSIELVKQYKNTNSKRPVFGWQELLIFQYLKQKRFV